MADSSAYPIFAHRLDNGLRVVVSPDHVAPVVAMNLWYDVGSRHERPGRTGLAHLFEHLMFEGSTNIAAGEHMRVVQECGGYVNATTSSERTVYIQTVPVDQLELMLYLEADRMGGLLDAVTQEALDKQRDVVKNERRQRYDDQPYGSFLERLHQLLFPVGHPYHHTTIGFMDDLDAASLEDVHDFFRSHYAPDNAVLSIVGHIEPDRAFEMAEAQLGHLPAHGAIAPPPDGALSDPLPSHGRLHLAEAVPAAAFFLGFRLPPDGDHTLYGARALCAILGLGRASSLERRLVDGELAQQIFQLVDARRAGASLGILGAVARPGVSTAALEGVIREEIARLAELGPSDIELERAKSMLERRWLDRVGTLEGRAEELSGFTTTHGDPDRLNAESGLLRSPSAADVRMAAQELFSAENGVVVEYEPLKQEVAA